MRKRLRHLLLAIAALAGLAVFIFYAAMYCPYPIIPWSLRVWVYCTVMPKHLPPPHWTLYHEIKTADEVLISRVDVNALPWLPSLDHEHNAQMLELLHKSHHFHSSPPQVKTQLYFGILKSDGKDNESATGPTPFPTYNYAVETGELGQDHEWCYVPQEFRDWMKAVVAGAPEVQIDSSGRTIPQKAVPYGPQKQ